MNRKFGIWFLCIGALLLLIFFLQDPMRPKSPMIEKFLLNLQTPQRPKLVAGIVTVVDHPLPNYDASTLSKSRLIVLPTFSLLNQAIYNNSTFVKSDGLYRHTSSDKITQDKLEERMLDFLESLQHTLKHPLVSKVLIRYDQDALPDYLSNRIGMHPKLKLIRTSDAYSPLKTLEFVHNHLQNELVMIINADVYPGKGLEKLDFDLMKRKRLFYSPSRHGQKETRCKIPPQFCDPGVKYPGAHDAYIFIPSGSLPSAANSIFSGYKWDSHGTENAILYMYQNHLKYKVLNPCKVIFLYHNHCSNLRRSFQTREVPKRYPFFKPPSDELE